MNTQELKLSRVEVVKKAYDSQGRICEETWEYYYPKEEDTQIIGFKKGNKK